MRIGIRAILGPLLGTTPTKPLTLVQALVGEGMRVQVSHFRSGGSQINRPLLIHMFTPLTTPTAGQQVTDSTAAFMPTACGSSTTRISMEDVPVRITYLDGGP